MLLNQLDIPFDIIVSNIDEHIEPDVPPEQQAQELALYKAQTVASSLRNALVIGADTIVVDDHGILGKPEDEQDAFRMLSRLSGQVHRVITGVAIISISSPSKILVSHETTKVKITTLSDQDILWYIHTGEPLDKAGAYAIQGKGTIFVEWIQGCYNNVVGLPLFLLVNMLREVNCGCHLLKRPRQEE